MLKVTGAGHRVEKYAHRLGESLNLGRRELALLAVLMLRGPQTVGELRSRTERMHPFADLEEVEHLLKSLSERQPDPLVAPASRGRWRHLWTDEVEDEPESRPVRPSLEGRVSALEHEIDELKRQLEGFRRQFE